MSSLLFVFNCYWSGFGLVTIPVDGVKVDKFGPSSFLWLGFGKNSLKEVKLLEINLWVPSNCKNKKDVKSTKDFQKEKKKKRERERRKPSYII